MVSTAYELATAYDIGRKELIFCSADDTIREVAKDLRSKDIGSMIVKSGDGYAGIITEDNILHAISEGVNVLDKKVGEIELDTLHTIKKNATLSEVSNLFASTGTTRAGVVDEDGRIVAVVKKKNLELFDRFSFVDRAYHRR